MEPLSRGQSNISDEDMERLRSILISQGMTPTLSASGRRAPGGVNSPPRTPLMMSFGSDTGVSDGDDSVGGFELPPTLLTGASWTVDPNMNVPENFSLTGVDLTSAQLPEQMIDLMDDYAYWLSVVDRLGFDNKHIFQFEEIPSLEILSRFFDSSHLGLLRVFHIFDKDRDALITRAEIAEGLRQQGFYTHVGSQVADLAFDEFCELLTRRSAHTAAAAAAAVAAASSAGPSSQLVSPPEFLLSLRCLRLAAVVHDYMYPSRLGVLGDQESDIILNYHEYREDKIWSHLPLEGPISFLYQNAESAESATCRVHWIHSHEPSIRTVLALGVKYGLDPRFTLDILSLWKQKALVDRSLSYVARTRGEDSLFDNPSEVQTFIDREWIFVIIPILRLSEDSAKTMIPFNEWRLNDLRKRNDYLEPPAVFIQVETCNLGIFASGRGIGGTIISFTTEWVSHGEVETSNELTPEESILAGYMGISAMSTGNQRGGRVSKIWDRIWGRKTPQSSADTMPGGISFGSYKQSSRGDSSAEDIAPGFNEDFRVFSKIMTQLRTAYSHLRTGDAHTLFLKQLCDITEDYVNVIIAYDAALTIIGMRLDDKRDGLEQYEVQRLNACRQQITQMVRAVRPVAIVIDILDAREWGGDSELYLSDVKSNIIKFLDNANGIREKADLLAGQFRHYCDARTQKVLVILTLVTTLMTPLLFLTSLEGMNFGDMPELKLQYGYLYFWIVCITIVVSVLLFYRKQKWI